MMTNYKQFFMVALVCLAAALGSTSTPAATFSSNPVADAFVTPGPASSPTPGTDVSSNNYGAAGVLDVAASGMPHGEAQSVLRFNMAGAMNAFNTQFGAGQWSIQSITLQLTAVAPGTNSFLVNTPAAGNFSVSWMQSDSWIEGTGKPTTPTTDGITWNSLPTFLGAGDQALGTFSFGGGTSGSNTYTLNLTSGPTADILAGGLLSLRLLSADSNVSYLFDSRSAASGQPVLTVTAIPEPGSITLGLFGVSLLIGWSRRRR
jgi:hypothetical protein